MAMAGGNKPAALGAALASVKDWVANKWTMTAISHLTQR
jgi:hypothetical protein